MQEGVIDVRDNDTTWYFVMPRSFWDRLESRCVDKGGLCVLRENTPETWFEVIVGDMIRRQENRQTPLAGWFDAMG